MGAGDAASLADPRVDLPIARGPSIPIARGSMLPAIVVVVNRNLLDPTRGLHMGSAELERSSPSWLRSASTDWRRVSVFSRTRGIIKTRRLAV